jgi:hypothetical protein
MYILINFLIFMDMNQKKLKQILATTWLTCGIFLLNATNTMGAGSHKGQMNAGNEANKSTKVPIKTKAQKRAEAKKLEEDRAKNQAKKRAAKREVAQAQAQAQVAQAVQIIAQQPEDKVQEAQAPVVACVIPSVVPYDVSEIDNFPITKGVQEEINSELIKEEGLKSLLRGVTSESASLQEIVKQVKSLDLDEVAELEEYIHNNADKSGDDLSGNMLAQLKTLISLSPEELGEYEQRLMPAIVPMNIMVFDNTKTVHHRLNKVSAVAAGSGDDEKKSVRLDSLWSEISFGSGKQKAFNNQAKDKNYHVTLGSDFVVSDNLLLGVAYTNSVNQVKSKGIKSGNSTKSNLHFISFYGQYSVSSNLDVSAIASINSGNTDVTSRRLVGHNMYQLSKGRMKQLGHTVALNASYRLVDNNGLFIIPTAGIKYNRQHHGSYREHGTLLQNFVVSAQKYETINTTAGLEIGKVYRVSNVTSITPTVHASVDHTVCASGDKYTKAKLSWAENQPYDYSIKNPKLKGARAYSTGVGLEVEHKDITVTLSGEYSNYKKYSNYQGTIKLKLNF